MTSSSRAPAAQDPASAALALFNEVRAALGLSAFEVQRCDSLAIRELEEAHALLTMLAGVMGPAASPEARQDARHAWNKAVRRRGWTALPALPESRATPRSGASLRGQSEAPQAASWTPSPQGAAADVRRFLACFGVALDANTCAAPSLARAHALCRELQRDADALGALPLLSPETYARRFLRLTRRWNDLARECGDLPEITGA